MSDAQTPDIAALVQAYNEARAIERKAWEAREVNEARALLAKIDGGEAYEAPESNWYGLYTDLQAAALALKEALGIDRSFFHFTSK